ncbi:MAG TPA: hypothetical protein VFQ80_15950 [Thermomicrobiales bacterium]|jgi:hypothetical protein|nr:hypothetical protein [Thermomicrobiales bacterium]
MEGSERRRRMLTIATRFWRAARRSGQRLALVGAAVASLGIGTALAGARLDQQNPLADNLGFGHGIEMTATDGQTFTAGATGSLDRIAVYLEQFDSAPPPGTIFVDVYPTDANGLPRTDGDPIGSGSVATSGVGQLPGFVAIQLSRPAPVKKGKGYAILLRSDVDLGLSLLWDGSTESNPYPNGGNAQRANANSPWTVFPRQDHFFKTFVTEPRHRHK